MMVDTIDEVEGGDIQTLEEKTDIANEVVLKDYALMLKENRSWGFGLLLIGALHVVTSGFLSAPWGIMLIAAGLASFYFRTAPMFIVYAVTLAWAGLSNLIGGETGWIILAFFQMFLAFSVFRKYRRFRDAESNYAKLATTDATLDRLPAERAARFFPWLGALLSCSSLLGLVLVFIIALVLAVVNEDAASIPEYFYFIEGLVVAFGVLGFAIGLASLLARYRLKGLAITAIVAGVLTVAIELVFLFL
jgi:hypothetical protein